MDETDDCWLCGKPGRVAADDGFGWAWVPADGTWYHCDGCGVSWTRRNDGKVTV